MFSIIPKVYIIIGIDNIVFLTRIYTVGIPADLYIL